MANEVVLRPSYWASVSGGKDSLYMLMLILSKPDKYPLDGVVHFELEIDFPFIKNVINSMERICSDHNIPFVRLKPKTSWFNFYDRYGFPGRTFLWCKHRYKLEAKKQLEDFLKSRGDRLFSYIGLCADETKRFLDSDKYSIYPLVLEGIPEKHIQEWARNQPIFNNYYKFNMRCGCMFCPYASMMNLAYLCVFYPNEFDKLFLMVNDTESKTKDKGYNHWTIFQSNTKYDAKYYENRIRSIYVPKILNIMNSEGILNE